MVHLTPITGMRPTVLAIGQPLIVILQRVVLTVKEVLDVERDECQALKKQIKKQSKNKIKL